MRTERDSMGEMELPDDALYGASTQRARLNFPISGYPLPAAFLHGLGLVKLACARVNARQGRLDTRKAAWIEQAAREVADGRWDAHFPVDIFQTGSGTSTNTNANEVIANRVSQLAGEPLGSKRPAHPNDDINLGQSSNDVIPTALHLSVSLTLQQKLRPALQVLAHALDAKATAFANVIKIGRTHLMDATPLTMGQVFSGYAAQLHKSIERTDRATTALRELAIGGTAVGTGLNCPPGFAAAVVAELNAETQLDFIEAPNHFEAQAARDGAVEVAGLLNVIAASLAKIASDLRLLASGPRCGLGELQFPATQPGSSIMPGKVNPVMCEMLIQATHHTQGLMHTVIACGRDGQFELNVTLPLLAHTLHEAVRILANAAQTFTEKALLDLQVNADHCAETVERSLMLVTALVPHLGYDRAAEVAKTALATGQTLREIILKQNLLPAATLDKALNPNKMLG